MRSRTPHLLAELHAHTTWSDGVLTVPAYNVEEAPSPGRLTQRFARDAELCARVHRFELSTGRSSLRVGRPHRAALRRQR